MRFGFVVPHGDARDFAQVTALGERHGWDGVFTWEAVWGVHAWVTLGAASMVTERIRLGTLLTPVSRWKPWDLASAVGTVDRLSGGRVILGAGLGALHGGWTAFEADEGRRARAQKLDECLDIYAGLMRGQPFGYHGTYYSAEPTDFMPPDPPVQRPHPPVGMGCSRRSSTPASPGTWAVPASLPSWSAWCGRGGTRSGSAARRTTWSSRRTARGSSCSSTRPSRLLGRRRGPPGGWRAGGPSRPGPRGSTRSGGGSRRGRPRDRYDEACPCARLTSMCTCRPRTGWTAAWPATSRRPRPTSALPRSGSRSMSWRPGTARSR